MQITPETIFRSVIAVPPLARHDDLSLNHEANRTIVDYIKSGGVKTFLYGGNANFYHIRPSEYGRMLEMLTDYTSDDTWVIPSVGPAYGTMMDQAEVVRDFSFPTVMILPHRELATSSGINTAVRQFVERANVPIVLYIKHDGWIDVAAVRQLVDDGLVSMIKYAIVRTDPAQDDYLRELVDAVDKKLIVSGIGEQPAIIHLRDFGLAGFTSGCVCVAPNMAMRMLSSLQAQDYDYAESLRQQFKPLEDLRNSIHPIRVLHDAVRLADIADTGPVLPLLSGTTEQQQHEIKQAAVVLRQLEHGTKV
jgi:dihydrodipicolinate synthase/N-acetylneuraminate lyase